MPWQSSGSAAAVVAVTLLMGGQLREGKMAITGTVDLRGRVLEVSRIVRLAGGHRHPSAVLKAASSRAAGSNTGNSRPTLHLCCRCGVVCRARWAG